MVYMKIIQRFKVKTVILQNSAYIAYSPLTHERLKT